MASDIAQAVPGNGHAAPRSRRFRRYAVNLLRFASALVGAGLLIRTGASEQASSAVDGEQHTSPAVPALRDRQPQLTAAALPKPAFGQPAAEARKFGALMVAVGPAASAAKSGTHHLRIPPEQSAAALAAPAANMAAGRELSAQKLVQVRRTDELNETPGAAAPMIAPAQVASVQPAKAAVAPAAQLAPSFAQPVAAAPAPVAAPVPVARIVAVHPSATPGQRAGVQTHSDIRQVMNRPASAWDYAYAAPAVTMPAIAPVQASATPRLAPTQALASAPAAPVAPAARSQGGAPPPAAKPVAQVQKPAMTKPVAQASEKAVTRPVARAMAAVPAKKLAQSAPDAPRPAAPSPSKVTVLTAPTAPKPAPMQKTALERAGPPMAGSVRSEQEARIRASAETPKASQSLADARPQDVVRNTAANSYLPENNVAAAPVSRNALSYLAAMAARTKPTNAMASSAMARADTSASSGSGIRDRMPSPQF